MDAHPNHKRLAELEISIRQLKGEIDIVLSKSNKISDNPQTLPLSAFIGYTLSSFSTQERGMEIEYEAWCRGHFRFAVTEEKGQITKVDIDLTEDSAFHEIEADLSKLCKRLSPPIVLMTIQQFSLMKDLQTKVLQFIDKSKSFRYYQFDPKDGINRSPTCTVRAYRVCGPKREVIIELNWTFAWHDAYHALTHKFSIVQENADNADPLVLHFISTLKTKIFHCHNQDILWEEWEKFCWHLNCKDQKSSLYNKSA